MNERNVDETRKSVDVPTFLNSDCAMIYTGKSLPFVGLMSGDIVCIRYGSSVPEGAIAVARKGEENILGPLWENKVYRFILMPFDERCSFLSFSDTGKESPKIIGEVTGWVHSTLKEADQVDTQNQNEAND